MTWDERFELAKVYYEYYGHLKIRGDFKTKNGYEVDENGFPLGKWVKAQRLQYNIGELTDVHKQKLLSIGMIFENINDIDWYEFYELYKKYYEYHHTLKVPKNFKTKNGYEVDEKGKDLSAWVIVQRRYYRNGTISVERKQKLDELGDILENYSDGEWNKIYELAKKYYEHHQNLELPENFKTINGYQYDKDGFNLSNWIKLQRGNYKKGILTVEKIQKLEQINMIFENINDYRWERMYNLAKSYYEYHGNLKIHRQFKTLNGFEESKDGYNLGKWVNAQYGINFKGKLPTERIEKLEKIGMVFHNQKEESWNKMYELLKIYYEHHGNLNIKVSFKTNNGYEYDETGKPLGQWLNRQRSAYKKCSLSEYHMEKMNEIAILIDELNDRTWERMYDLAKIYYEYHGNLNIKINFKTNNGYEYDKSGQSLGVWLNNQKCLNCKEKQERLEQIGMKFESINDIRWERMYNLAKAFYEHHQHLKLKLDFKTVNGYEYDANGENLEDWINYQRTIYKTGKLSEERIKKLQLIGMIFDIRKEKQQNVCTCLAYDINYKKYKKQIDFIPHKEFIAKINYLNNNGMSFEMNDQLHPIFFMSSINLEVRYGLNLQQMIDDYYMFAEKMKVKVR